jgi:hypothetical protein
MFDDHAIWELMYFGKARAPSALNRARIRAMAN